MGKNETLGRQRHCVFALLRYVDLTDWEYEFLKSTASRLNEGIPLWAKQDTKLMDIYKEKEHEYRRRKTTCPQRTSKGEDGYNEV